MGCTSSNAIEIVENDKKHQFPTNIGGISDNAINLRHDVIIPDTMQSMDWWKLYISSNDIIVDYMKFIHVFYQHFVENKYCVDIETLTKYFNNILDRDYKTEILKNCLGFNTFDRYIARYGPLTICFGKTIKNLCLNPSNVLQPMALSANEGILNQITIQFQPWFCGYIQKEQVNELLLKKKNNLIDNIGRFLIRYSETYSNKLVISVVISKYKLENNSKLNANENVTPVSTAYISNILIANNGINGYHIIDSASLHTNKAELVPIVHTATIPDILINYKEIFKYPCNPNMKEVEPPTEAEIPTELNGGEQMKENLKKPSSIHKDVQNIDVNRDIDLVVLAASEVDSDDQSDMEVESSVCIVDGYGTYMPTTSKSVDAMQAHPVISSSLEEENSPYGAFTTAANMPPIPTSYADNAYSEVLDPYGTFVDLVESEGEPMLATVEVEDTPLIPLSYAEHSPNDIYGAFMGTIESNDASHTPSETSMRPLEERELFLTYIRSLMTNHVERDTMLDSFGEDVEVNEMKCHLYKCAYSYVYKPVLSKQGAKISPTDMENMPIYASSPMSPCLGQIDKSPLDALNNNVRIIQFEVIPTSTDDDNTLPVSHWIWANAWEYLQKMETENYASNIIATECMDHGTTQYANAIKKNPTTSTVVHFESCLKDALTLLLKAAHHSMLCGDLILTVRSLVNIGTVQVKLKNNKSAVSYYLCAIGLLRYLRDAFSNNLIPICHCPNHDSSDSKANTNLNQNLTTICSNYFQHFVFNNKICVVTLEFEKKVLFSLCQCLSSIAIASNNFVGSNIEISVDDINDQKHAYELFILCVQQFLLYTMDPSCSTTSAIAEKEKIIKLLNKTRINNNQ